MSFELQPLLESKAVSLRPLLPEDYEALRQVLSDPLIWEQHPAKERAQPEGFRVFFNESLNTGGALVITDAITGAIIGSSRYHGHSEAIREIEIGWSVLARSHWGGIFNREVKRLMLEHAFKFVDRVVFLVAPENFRSQRAMEKVGGVRDGSRTDANGHESYLYGIDGAAFRDKL